MFWQIFGRTLNDEDFIRERGRGGLNHFLNYGYAVLLSTVLQKLFGVGLDPTFGISHVERERSTPLAYDLMEQFRPCVDWRVVQWVRKNPDPNKWEVTKEYRKWVTGFPLERADYLDLTLEIQGVIEGVVRGFRKKEFIFCRTRFWNQGKARTGGGKLLQSSFPLSQKITSIFFFRQQLPAAGFNLS
jgi:CRISPR-associated protein Cas1